MADLSPSQLSGLSSTLTPGYVMPTVDPYKPGAAPGQPNYVAPSTGPSVQAPSTAQNDPTASYYSQLAAETRRQNQLLSAQIAAAPKLIKYDTAGAAATALSQATAAQTPVYTQKLNDYLAKTTIQRNAENRNAAQAIQDAQDQLAANLAQNDTSRTRTAQDTATKIADTTAQEGNFLDTSGDAADQARRDLTAANATAGLSESGLGAQAVDTQEKGQNATSNEAQRQFEATKTAANLFQSRTFEDLANSDELAKLNEGKTESRTKLDLQDFLDTSNIDEASTRDDLEQQRQGAILVDSSQRQQNAAKAFIASLVKSGARPQDIALAAQIYGG